MKSEPGARVRPGEGARTPVSGGDQDSAKALRGTWQAVLGRLELEVSRANFETWLAGTTAASLSDGELLVEARSAFRAEWMNENLAPVVERCLGAVEGGGLAVRFIAPGEEPHAAAAASPSGTAPSGREEVVGQVNGAFTLARYFRSEGSALALTSCLSLVEEREPAISPVVVHGPPGVGKTHLLHGLAAQASGRGQRVACLSGEGFTSRYQRALREGNVEAFQDAVRGVQLLIIDDLHDLAGKTGTLRELVHTLDAVTHGGGAVVVGSELRPRELGLPERLCSRLEAGIVATVEPFAAGERRAFIEQRLADLRVALPSWCLEQLATGTGSVRSILAGVHAAVGLQRRGLLNELRLAAEVGALAPQQRGDETTKAVIERIAEHFAVAVGEVEGRSRAQKLARPRAVAAAALQERGCSYSEIGALLGGRSRSTIKGLAERGRALGAEDPAVGDLLRAG
ncbi:MAG: DnaA/Hda family protein [Chloroflexota bacterium]|nr:DnaA/Hda family protein [Chloroflexota bacterium]